MKFRGQLARVSSVFLTMYFSEFKFRLAGLVANALDTVPFHWSQAVILRFLR